MRSRCDATAPCALEERAGCFTVTFFLTSHPDSADVHHGYLFVIRMLWPWMLTRLQNGMPTDQTHLLHRLLENAQNASGFVAVVFFCKQDLWSWIAAILQDSMLSVLLHLFAPHCFFSFFSWCLAPSILANAMLL